MANDFVVLDASDFRQLHRALRDIDKVQARGLSSKLRSIVKPLEENVRRAALKIPVDPVDAKDKRGKRERLKKGQTVGLRRGIAYAVESRVGSSSRGANARIRVSGTKFAAATGGYKKLPRYMEGLNKKKRPWRHPVFADKGKTLGTWEGKWAEQKPKPYLLPTVLPKKDAIRKALIEQYQETFAEQLRSFGIPVR